MSATRRASQGIIRRRTAAVRNYQAKMNRLLDDLGMERLPEDGVWGQNTNAAFRLLQDNGYINELGQFTAPRPELNPDYSPVRGGYIDGNGYGHAGYYEPNGNDLGIGAYGGY